MNTKSLGPLKGPLTNNFLSNTWIIVWAWLAPNPLKCNMVRETGIEPVCPRGRRILSSPTYPVPFTSIRSNRNYFNGIQPLLVCHPTRLKLIVPDRTDTKPPHSIAECLALGSPSDFGFLIPIVTVWELCFSSCQNPRGKRLPSDTNSGKLDRTIWPPIVLPLIVKISTRVEPWSYELKGTKYLDTTPFKV